jgi:hypothetical protein
MVLRGRTIENADNTLIKFHKRSLVVDLMLRKAPCERQQAKGPLLTIPCPQIIYAGDVVNRASTSDDPGEPYPFWFVQIYQPNSIRKCLAQMGDFFGQSEAADRVLPVRAHTTSDLSGDHVPAFSVNKPLRCLERRRPDYTVLLRQLAHHVARFNLGRSAPTFKDLSSGALSGTGGPDKYENWLWEKRG